MSLTRKIFYTFLASRLWLLFIGIFAYHFLPKQTGFIANLANWDGGYYLQIIKNGYPAAATLQSIWAFMPGFPLLIKLLSFGQGSDMIITIIGVLISNLLFLLSLFVIADVCKRLGQESIIINVVLLICFFPAAVYFSFFYTESLFLFLSLLAYWLILQKRWLLSALAIGYLTITRKPGIFMSVVFVIEFLKVRPQQNLAKYYLKLITLLLIQILPLAIFVYYLQTLSGSYFTLLTVQTLWSKIPIFPFSGIYDFLIDHRFTNFLHLFFWGCFAFLLRFNWKKLPISLVIYSVLQLYIIVSAGELASIIRYLAVIFPIFIILAEVLARRNLAFKITLAVFAGFQVLLLILFIGGYGFAT